MNQDNTIKSLIPKAILEDIPSERRAHVASRIVEFFREANPELYEQIGDLATLSEEMMMDCVEKVRAAALAAYNHHRRPRSDGE